MYYLANAFSLNMLPIEGHAKLIVDALPLLPHELGTYLKGYDLYSVVGHQSTADFLSSAMGMPVVFNREQVRVKYGDSIYIAQLNTRLPEGKILTRQEMDTVEVQFYVINVGRQ